MSGLDRGASFLDAEVERMQAKPARGLAFLTPDEVLALPPIRWRVKGVLPESGIAAIYGPSGSGKSFLTLDLLSAIAGGKSWFGRSCTAAPIGYAALEGEAGVAQRLRAYAAINGGLPDRLRVLLQGFDLRREDDCAELVAAARAAGVGGGVLCLDTLNQAAPGADENSSSDVGTIIAAAKRVQADLGGLVLIVSHTGKDVAKGLRGHSSLFAALDAAVEVKREGQIRHWQVAKSKDGTDQESHPFRLEVVPLGEDSEGDPITSCVVVPDDGGAAMLRPALPKGKNSRLIWPALKDMFIAKGEHRPDGVPEELPIGRPVLSLEEAIEGSKNRLVCDSDQRGYRARLAIESLVTSGFLTCRGGWLWVS